jgi:hypothetical protein
MTVQTLPKIALRRIAKGNQPWMLQAISWRVAGIGDALDRARRGKAVVASAREIHTHAANLDFLLKWRDMPDAVTGMADRGDAMMGEALSVFEIFTLTQAIVEITTALNMLRRHKLRWWCAKRIEIVAVRMMLIAERLENKPDIGA